MRAPLVSRLEEIEELERLAELHRLDLLEQDRLAQQRLNKEREQAERELSLTRVPLAPTAIQHIVADAVMPRISAEAVLAPIEAPSLRWEESHDRDTAARIGRRYMQTHPEIDWRSVYAEAVVARSQGVEVKEMVEQVVRRTKARLGDVRNFLISSRLARTK